MKSGGYKRTNSIVWLGILTGLLPYFILSFYAQPQADDFFFAAWFREMSLWEYMKANLTCCNGRYFGVFLVGLNPLSFGNLQAYPIVPSLTLGLLLLAIFTLTRQALGQENRKHVALFSFMATLLLLNGLPSTAQGIYWANASVFHTWASILLIFFLSLFIWNPIDHSLKIARTLIGILLCAMITGLNEIAMLLLIGLLILRIILFIKVDKQETFINLFWLITSIAGAMVVFFMPGTSSRMDALPGAGDLAFSLLNAAKLSTFLIGMELQQPAFLLWSLIVVAIFSQMNHNALTLLIDRVKPKWLIPAFSLAIIFSMYFAAIFMLGGYPPWRVHNTVAITFQVLWYINVFTLVRSRRNDLKSLSHSFVRGLLYLGIFWFLFTDFSVRDPREPTHFRGNTARAWYDLVVTAPDYHTAISLRFNKLNNASRQDTIVFKGLPNQCPSLYFADIEPDPAALNNAIMSYYFQVGAVKLDSTKMSAP